MLRDWVEEAGSYRVANLLYQGSRDGMSSSTFTSSCNCKGPILIIIETNDGKIIGGYLPDDPCGSSADNSIFLFALSGIGTSSGSWSRKNKGDVLYVTGSNVRFSMSDNEGTSHLEGNFAIKEIEVFQVNGSRVSLTPVSRFSTDINEASNSHNDCLDRAEAGMLHLEQGFKNEQMFIEKFTSGDAEDTVTLNVSGTTMTTTRSTLCAVKDSVLAQQSDDSKWTEQGCSGTRVKDWTPDEVNTWANTIDGIPEEVGATLFQNKITGQELLALSLDGLRMMGIERVGTVCQLLKKIEKLEKSGRDVVTLIEHSPNCFGKILDHLRLKRLHSLGLIATEPTPPDVRDTQRKRFEKVVSYYFPGDSAKAVIGISDGRDELKHDVVTENLVGT